MEDTKTVALSEIKTSLNAQLKDPEVLKTLLATTFKGLQVESAKQAMLEGMMRGFSFKDFLEKNIYAVPYGQGYSLVTSIDYVRKVGMRSGIVGKLAPTYEEKDGKIISCTITVKRMVNEYVGEFTATVYFNEYNTGRNQWTSKPHTMIAKVAEMHALRMACPEELSQSYVEEEYQQEVEKPKVAVEDYKAKLEKTKNTDELKKVWADIPAEAKKQLEPTKNLLKESFEKSVSDKELQEIAQTIDGTIV